MGRDTGQPRVVPQLHDSSAIHYEVGLPIELSRDLRLGYERVGIRHFGILTKQGKLVEG